MSAGTSIGTREGVSPRNPTYFPADVPSGHILEFTAGRWRAKPLWLSWVHGPSSARLARDPRRQRKRQSQRQRSDTLAPDFWAGTPEISAHVAPCRASHRGTRAGGGRPTRPTQASSRARWTAKVAAKWAGNFRCPGGGTAHTVQHLQCSAGPAQHRCSSSANLV